MGIGLKSQAYKTGVHRHLDRKIYNLKKQRGGILKTV